MWLIVLWTLIVLIFLVKIPDVRNLFTRWRQMPLALMVACAFGALYLGTYSYSKSGTNAQRTASSEGSVSEPPAQNPESRTSSMPAWWVHDETDTDGDGIPDLWEKWTHGNPLVADSHLDRDGDGLTDLEEFWNQTDPRTADTDGDGFSDAFEVAHGMDPLVPEDFTPTEHDLNNNDIIDIWEHSGYIYGFTDVDGDGFDDTYEWDLPAVSDANFDIVVEVYTTRSAVLTWRNEDASDGIVILPTSGTSVKLRLPFGADTELKLLPAPEGTDPPSGELWKSRIRIVFDGRAGQNLSGNALVSPSGMIAHKVVNMGSVIKHFSGASPDGGFQPQTLGGDGSEGPNADIIAGKFEVFHVGQYHYEGDTVGPFTIINTVGLATATYNWYSKYGDMNPATGLESWLTVRKVPSHHNEKIIVVATAELDTQSGVSVEREVERCSPRVFSAGLSTQNFSPHLGDTLGIGVTVPGCGHRYTPGWLEIEVVREVIGAIQHVASVDMDNSTSTGDRYLDTSALGGQTLSFEWDGIAQSGLGLADHPDKFVGPKGSFQRAMPAVVAGEPVPPPFYMVVVRLWDEDKSTVLNEVSQQVYIPQVVNLLYDSAITEKFSQAINYASDTFSNIALFSGCTHEEAQQALATLPEVVMQFIPEDINIRFVCNQEVAGLHKTVSFSFGAVNPNMRGLAFALVSRNYSPSGVTFLFMEPFAHTLQVHYANLLQEMEFFKVPLTNEQYIRHIAATLVHESGHLLGLVDKRYFEADENEKSICHNKNRTGRMMMDAGGLYWMPLRLNPHKTKYWLPIQQSYLNFILPKGNDQ